MSRAHRFLFLAFLLAPVATLPAAAQQADPADVESMDAIVAAIYDVISGPAGQPRDAERWHSLFIDGARLIPVGRGEDGVFRPRVITPADYVERSFEVLQRNGFFEVEVGRVTESFGQIAHLFSTYESRRNADDVEPFARGINSFQLMNDGSRWWVVSIMWDSERPDNPIPRRYIGR